MSCRLPPPPRKHAPRARGLPAPRAPNHPESRPSPPGRRLAPGRRKGSRACRATPGWPGRRPSRPSGKSTLQPDQNSATGGSDGNPSPPPGARRSGRDPSPDGYGATSVISTRKTSSPRSHDHAGEQAPAPSSVARPAVAFPLRLASPAAGTPARWLARRGTATREVGHGSYADDVGGLVLRADPGAPAEVQSAAQVLSAGLGLLRDLAGDPAAREAIRALDGAQVRFLADAEHLLEVDVDRRVVAVDAGIVRQLRLEAKGGSSSAPASGPSSARAPPSRPTRTRPTASSCSRRWRTPSRPAASRAGTAGTRSTGSSISTPRWPAASGPWPSRWAACSGLRLSTTRTPSRSSSSRPSTPSWRRSSRTWPSATCSASRSRRSVPGVRRRAGRTPSSSPSPLPSSGATSGSPGSWARTGSTSPTTRSTSSGCSRSARARTSTPSAGPSTRRSPAPTIAASRGRTSSG